MIQRFNTVMLFVWIGPGAVVSWFFRGSVAWVTFMSLYAIVVGHLAARQADTP